MLEDNKAAGSGGAIYNESGSGLLEIRNGSIFRGNSAAKDGGAIFNAGQLQIGPDCQVTVNAANNAQKTFKGGGLFLAGSLVNTDDAVLDQVFNNNFPDDVYIPPLPTTVRAAQLVLVNKAN